MAGLGGVSDWLMKYCLNNAQAPATAGEEWLVPEDSVKNCWPTGKKLLAPNVSLPGTAQTPRLPAPKIGSYIVPKLKKQSKADPVPLGDGGGKLWGAPPVMCEHGATISGLIRPSAQGPRPEKLAMSFALLASAWKVAQPSSPAVLLPPLAVDMERTFSVPPTAMTFFAVLGAVTVAEPGPPSPSEK